MITVIQILASVISATLILASALQPCADIVSSLKVADLLFKSDGPTSHVLAAYDQVVAAAERERDRTMQCLLSFQMAQIYYKKAIIELHLQREPQALTHLKRVISLDPANPARQKLVDLLLKRGDFAAVKQYSPQTDILLLESQWNDVRAAHENHDWEKCYSASTILIAQCPKMAAALEIRCEACQHILEKQGYEYRVDQVLVSKTIVEDLEALVALNPFHRLDRYALLAKHMLYSQNNVDRATEVAKQCLQIDNDNKECGALSKYLTRMGPVLRPIAEHALSCARLYIGDLGEEANLAAYPEPLIDWLEMLDTLFVKPIMVSKAEKRRIPKSVANNLQLIELRAREFDNGPGSTEFLNHLQRFVCEARVRVDPNNARAACAKVDNLFFPKYVPRIDKLFRKGRVEEVRAILEKFPKPAHQLSLFKERLEKLNEITQQERQRQQHQQHQQHFNQQRQYQQHHQQQQQQQQKIPDEDYYKILDIKEDADDREIKRAYRAQSLKYHPDVYKGTELDEAAIEKKMQDINAAKEILSNKEQREIYDRQRKGDYGQQFQGGQHQGSPGHGQQNMHFDFSNFKFHFN